jgi:hypothetical protein
MSYAIPGITNSELNKIEYLKCYYLGLGNAIALLGEIPELLKTHMLEIDANGDEIGEMLAWLNTNCPQIKFVQVEEFKFKIQFADPITGSMFFVPPKKPAPATTTGAGSRHP